MAMSDSKMYYYDIMDSLFLDPVSVHSCGAGEHGPEWSWQTDGSVRYCAFSVLVISEDSVELREQMGSTF